MGRYCTLDTSLPMTGMRTDARVMFSFSVSASDSFSDQFSLEPELSATYLFQPSAVSDGFSSEVSFSGLRRSNESEPPSPSPADAPLKLPPPRPFAAACVFELPVVTLSLISSRYPTTFVDW